MPVIQVSHFTKLYGNFKAVNDISFQVNQGEIIGFVGKNGAGKSTTIRAMMNFIKPTEGTCTLFGLDSVSQSKAIRNTVGYMPSDAMFYEGITVREVFTLCTKISHVPFEEAETLCQHLELDMNKPISTLSLGNRKKVSIIQAMLRDSKLLILDEPTSGLDPLMQERFFELLLAKQKQGGTIFLSSHNLSEIEKYCDRVLIIKDGKLIEQLNMKDVQLQKGQVVSYKTKDGESITFTHSGEANDLIEKLSQIDLVHVEIRNQSVEDMFIQYYQEDAPYES